MGIYRFAFNIFQLHNPDEFRPANVMTVMFLSVIILLVIRYTDRLLVFQWRLIVLLAYNVYAFKYSELVSMQRPYEQINVNAKKC